MRSAAASKLTELTEHDLGCKVSMLFRIDTDPEHPFSEAVGVLQRVEQNPSGTVYHLVRRNGETVIVPSNSIISLKKI